jgi:hypothetical protein
VPTAYSFECDLKFGDAVKRFDAMEDWFRKPNLDGRWLVRDNDRLGDYLSYHEYDAADPTIVKSICIYFDTRPLQITFDVGRNPKVRAGPGDLRSVWRAHETYVLEVLLPSIGARDVKPSDFER